ncbi:hypothetical protein STANM309S_02884 [Streptomyces tanashiensis]
MAWLQASVAQLRIHRRSGAEEPAHVQELRTAVVAATDRLRRRDRRGHPSLVRELAAEVGDMVPGLLSEAARTTGIDNSGGSAGALEWTLTEADVTDFVHTAKGSAAVVEEPPGAPERGALSRGKTSQEWGEQVSEYLDSAPAMGATSVPHALMEHRARSTGPGSAVVARDTTTDPPRSPAVRPQDRRTPTVRRGGGAHRPGATRPDSYAMMTSWARSRTVSFPMMRLTWVFAVEGGQAQALRDLRVVQAPGHQRQDLALAVRQRVRATRRRGVRECECPGDQPGRGAR